MPFAPGGVASQRCSSMLLRTKVRERDREKKELRRERRAGETGQGNWKFLLPLRFHFTPNHTTAGSILRPPNAICHRSKSSIYFKWRRMIEKVAVNRARANLDENVEEIVKN